MRFMIAQVVTPLIAKGLLHKISAASYEGATKLTIGFSNRVLDIKRSYVHASRAEHCDRNK